MKTKTNKTRQQNASGKASRDQIIVTAEQVLKKDGYHNLSTRRVADACGISVGNLTYHFPNKALLVEAIMVAVCNRYEKQRISIQFDGGNDSTTYVRGLIS